ncbi:MAG: ATP-binding protein [Chloroflexota bacterium]
MEDFFFEKHNPWWFDLGSLEADKVLAEFDAQKYQFRHPYLDEFSHQDGVIIIRGPRRIGKTTLLKLLVRELLLKQNVSPKNVLYFPCDRIENFNELYDLILNYLGLGLPGRKYLFLDEISFVREWQRAVKSLWDSGDLNQVTVILTGSNALDLIASGERLPGRRGSLDQVDIDYFPLRFDQFASMVGSGVDTQKLLHDYLMTGGFLHAINEFYGRNFISNYLYDTYLTWIEGDIYKAGKSERLMYPVLGEILSHLGGTISWYKIAKNAGLGSHSTVESYLDIFQKLFVAFPLNFYSVDQKKVFVNKNKKIYFIDPVVLQAIKCKVDGFTDRFFDYSSSFTFDQEFLPGLIENVVAAHLHQAGGRLAFGRFQDKEVDFVLSRAGKDHYFEVKYQNSIKLTDFAYWQKDEPLTVITKNFSLAKNNLVFVKAEEFLGAPPSTWIGE